MDKIKILLRLLCIFGLIPMLMTGTTNAAEPGATLQLISGAAYDANNDAIPAGTYPLQYTNSISTLPNTAISNISYSLGIDNMEHVVQIDESEYVTKNSTDITWVFPNSIVVNMWDYHLVGIKTDYYSLQYLPMALSRTMNQTQFSGEGYQRVSFNVLFENITYVSDTRRCDSIWTGINAGENQVLNASMLLDTFSTDAPGKPYPDNDIHHFQFGWNKSQVELDRVYNFSIMIRVVPNGTAPVIFKPNFAVVLFNGTNRNPGLNGLSTTMPDDMLPPHLHYASASQNVSLAWSYYLLYGKHGGFNQTRMKVSSNPLTLTRIGIVRNNNTWLLDASGNGAYGAGDLAYTFGKAGDVPVTGDWNNDGRTENGVVRNNNTWLLDASGNGAYGAGDYAYSFGKAGDIFITGDWNNDGKTEIGVVRNSNTWLLDASGNGAYGAGDYAYSFGKAGDVYVTGDWNNDGKTEIGVVRNFNTWLLDASGNGAYGAGDVSSTFGKAGDKYVTGKWS